MRRHLPLALLALLAFALPTGAGAGTLPPIPGGFRAATINTPGQSGHVSVLDLAKQTAGQDSYGPHMVDQLPLYEALRYKPGGFFRGGTPQSPRPGVEIYRDAWGVPAIWGNSIADAWYGAGYALSQDRMWQMHLLRMVAQGRLSELIGTDGLEMDVAQRRDFYTPAEYAEQFATLEDWEQEQLVAFAAGINQYILEMHLDPANKMPAEIAALALPVEPWTPLDSFALGTLIARSVASDGGQELENAALLADLVAAYGQTEAKKIFNDLIWLNDPGAPTSVPAEEGTFTSYPHGAPAPSALNTSLSLAADLPASARALAQKLVRERATRDRLREKLGLPNPGSDAWAVSPSRSANGNAFLFNGPQVGYTVAGLLVELEVHGGSGDRRLDAKGITVAGFPSIGIGYTATHGWGLTSGLSDTIDMYVEQLTGDRSYRLAGQERDMECRIEVFKIRNTLAPQQTGIHTEELCRTVHGPVLQIDTAGGVAYSHRYAMWKGEIGTMKSMFRWPYAKSLAEFEDAMRMVTWNENLTYADNDGNIAYWHPGMYPARPRTHDERLPYPGTGEAEWERLLTYDEMPHTINPAQGWVANWNSKPSVGWTSGDPHYGDRPWGQANRLHAITSVLESSLDVGAIPAPGTGGLIDGADGLFAPDVNAGLYDLSIGYFQSFLVQARDATSDPRLRQALNLMLAWNGNHQDGDANGKVDHPGLTIFHEWVQNAAKEIFAPYTLGHGGFTRGGHRTEPSPVINMFLRALKGTSASLPQSRDYLGGRAPAVAILETLDARLDALQTRFGTADMNAWLLPAFRVGLDVQGLGPGGSLAFQDRGSWIEAIEYFVG